MVMLVPPIGDRACPLKRGPPEPQRPEKSRVERAKRRRRMQALAPFPDEHQCYSLELYDGILDSATYRRNRQRNLISQLSDLSAQIFANTTHVLTQTSLSRPEQLEVMNTVRLVSGKAFRENDIESHIRIQGLYSGDFFDMKFKYHSSSLVFCPESDYECNLMMDIDMSSQPFEAASAWYVQWMNGRKTGRMNRDIQYFPKTKFGITRSHVQMIRQIMFTNARTLGDKLSDLELMKFVIASTGIVLEDRCDHENYMMDIATSSKRQYKDFCEKCNGTGYEQWPSRAVKIVWAGEDHFLENELRIICNERRPIDLQWERTDYDESMYLTQVQVSNKIEEEKKAADPTSYRSPPPKLQAKDIPKAEKAYKNLTILMKQIQNLPPLEKLCKYERERWLRYMPSYWKADPRLLEDKPWLKTRRKRKRSKSSSRSKRVVKKEETKSPKKKSSNHTKKSTKRKLLKNKSKTRRSHSKQRKSSAASQTKTKKKSSKKSKADKKQQENRENVLKKKFTSTPDISTPDVSVRSTKTRESSSKHLSRERSHDRDLEICKSTGELLKNKSKNPVSHLKQRESSAASQTRTEKESSEKSKTDKKQEENCEKVLEKNTSISPISCNSAKDIKSCTPKVATARISTDHESCNSAEDAESCVNRTKDLESCVNRTKDLESCVNRTKDLESCVNSAKDLESCS